MLAHYATMLHVVVGIIVGHSRSGRGIQATLFAAHRLNGRQSMACSRLRLNCTSIPRTAFPFAQQQQLQPNNAAAQEMLKQQQQQQQYKQI